jgi:hypothetical protein
MSIYSATYKDDKVINDILNKNSSEEPHMVVYHGGPWNGKREPYDPQKREMLVMEPMEPMSDLYYSTPNDTMMTYPKIVRYTPKTVARQWSKRHQRRVERAIPVGYDWVGRVIYAPDYETVIEYITFKEYGIAMVAEDWKGEPVMGENDYYRRHIVDVNPIYVGNQYE